MNSRMSRTVALVLVALAARVVRAAEPQSTAGPAGALFDWNLSAEAICHE